MFAPVLINRRVPSFCREDHKYAVRVIFKYQTGVSVYDVGSDKKSELKKYILKFSEPFSNFCRTETKSKSGDYILLCFEYPPIGAGDFSFSLLLAKEDFKNEVLNWEYKSTEPLDEYRRFLDGGKELIGSLS